MSEYKYEPAVFISEDAIRYLIESLHSLHRKTDAMSKTIAEVEASIADITSAATTQAADVAAKFASLQAQITALQSAVSPDFTQVLTDLASLKAIVVGADPGAPAAPAAPSTGDGAAPSA